MKAEVSSCSAQLRSSAEGVGQVCGAAKLLRANDIVTAARLKYTSCICRAQGRSRDLALLRGETVYDCTQACASSSVTGQCTLNFVPLKTCATLSVLTDQCLMGVVIHYIGSHVKPCDP